MGTGMPLPSLRRCVPAFVPLLLIFGATLAGAATAADLKVLKTGVGRGIVTGAVGAAPPSINCGTTCDATYATTDTVTLTATSADATSVFEEWGGACSGTAATCSVPMGANRVVRAKFRTIAAIPTLTSFTPADIQAYLNANTHVDSAARFIAALPPEFRQNWILMGRSESLQTGTARSPRILLISADARHVFTVGMTEHSSYPGSHPNAIEFMQWDGAEKNFRFHEIVLARIPEVGTPGSPGYFGERSRRVSEDDAKCFACHSTRNVLNRTPSSHGTTGNPVGSTKPKTKPNWDAYDSWGGALPFNRDRIHQDSLEAAAFLRLFNLWNWRGSDGNDAVRQVLEQLELQPPAVSASSNHRIARDIDQLADTAHIRFGFDGQAPLATTTGNTDYSFGAMPSVASSPVPQGGRYVTMRHPSTASGVNEALTAPAGDEGRAVEFFDFLGGLDGTLNALRIGDELTSHPRSTGNHAIDVRPVALAISKGCFRIDAPSNSVLTRTGMPALTVDQAFFNARNGMGINDLLADTRARAESLPRRKADIAKLAFDRAGDPYLFSPENGLIAEYGAGTADGTLTSTQRVRREVFRRTRDLGTAAVSIPGGVYVDREDYAPPGADLNTRYVALYRYFLEPLGVSVDKWSMSVRGRSRTYTFADVFLQQINEIAGSLQASLGLPVTTGCDAALVNLVNSSLAVLPAANEAPKYTDVQRIFNKACIECHGGLGYPPYGPGSTDLSEDETVTGGVSRLLRSHGIATGFVTTDPNTSFLYRLLTRSDERCPPGGSGMMPCGGPALSKADIETVKRWIAGGHLYSEGDPHLKTIDGVNYDFQGAGEFVLLIGEGFELQARQTPVPTAAPLGPDAHTGLTSCVSVNTAVALRVGPHRISYQQALGRGQEQVDLQLRIDGKAVKLGPHGVALASGGRVVATTAGGLRVQWPGGSEVVITPGWWAHHRIWYMNVNASHVRATDGVIGVVGPGQWLPALPDGTRLGSRPAALKQRFSDLYVRFADAWRVTSASSLFDYAAGESPKSFAMPMPFEPQSCEKMPAPTGRPVQPPLDVAVAEKTCSGVREADRRANCVNDVRATGEAGFARTYTASETLHLAPRPSAPQLVVPAHYEEIPGRPVRLSWNRAIAPGGGALTYHSCVWAVGQQLRDSDCESTAPDSEWRGGFFWASPIAIIGLILVLLLILVWPRTKRSLPLTLLVLILLLAGTAFFFGKRQAVSVIVAQVEPGQAYYWRVIAEDAQGNRTDSEMRRFSVK